MENDTVIIREVAPRDGWQNLAPIATDTKKLVLEALFKTGIREIEATSFVSPKWIPQSQDSAEIAAWAREEAAKRYPHIRLSALIPNLRGAKNAAEAGIDTVDIVMSLSDAHNHQNLNMSLEESFAQVRKIVGELKGRLAIRITFACLFGSYEGEIIPLDVPDRYVNACAELGLDKIALADSAGLATPDKMAKMVERYLPVIGAARMGLHIHDTRGAGIANAYAAYQAGARRFDCAMGGLGGCPFLAGASGNISTEDAVMMFDRMGVETGVDINKLKEASLFMYDNVQGKCNSRYLEIFRIQRAREAELPPKG